jgi:hypothetical protein
MVNSLSIETKGAEAETLIKRQKSNTIYMPKKPMVQEPRPSTKQGRPSGPARNNPPKNKG